MKKKFFKWAIVPVVAIIAAVSFSSFVQSDEGGTCYQIINGHPGPTVFGVSGTICDGYGSMYCSIKVPCK